MSVVDQLKELLSEAQVNTNADDLYEASADRYKKYAKARKVLDVPSPKAIIRNVYVGITTIDPSIIEAARGMGLTDRKILLRIQIPLAIPAAMTGVRTAVVMGIGIGAIASYIGAGGLGTYIFQGISRTNDNMVLIGAILISAMAILADKYLGKLQSRLVNPKRMLGRHKR